MTLTEELKKTNLFVITGMDGTGKTTLAKKIVSELQSNGYKSKYVWMRNNHTFAYILSEILLRLNFKKKFYNPNQMLVSRFHINNSFFAQNIWPIIDYLSLIPKLLFNILIPIFFGYKIVTDRYTIDTINTLKIKFLKKDFFLLNKILLSLYAKNTKFIVLTADLDTILDRRKDIEFTLDEIIYGKKLYEEFALKNNYAIFNTSIYDKEEIFLKTKNIIYFNKINVTLYDTNLDKTSIIIPTLNRTIKIEQLLKSIYSQSYYIAEIIIVDQSDTNETYNIFKKYKRIFKKKKTQINYKHLDIKNASIARNIGFNASKGDLIFFIDDDVILDKNYIHEIVKIYKNEPYAIGVQGIIYDIKKLYGYRTNKEKIYNIMKKIFYLSSYEKDKFIVLPSINDIYPYPITKNIKIERMQGICSYKRKVILNNKFDPALSGWSLFEDFDLSYNIYKSNIGFLILAKNAILYHTEHTHNVDTIKEQSYKKIYYRIYMFYKNIEQTPINIFIFYYSLMGLILSTLTSRMLGRHKEKTNYSPIYMIMGLLFSIKHLRDIQSKKIQRKMFEHE